MKSKQITAMLKKYSTVCLWDVRTHKNDISE